MNGNIQGRSAPSFGEWIGVGDSPRNMRASSIAGTGEERTELFEREAKSRGCGKSVGSDAKRQVLPKGKAATAKAMKDPMAATSGW